MPDAPDDRPTSDLPVPPTPNVAAVLRARAARHPDAPALVQDDGVLTHAALQARVARAAATLAAGGLRAGQVAALSLTRPEDTLVAMLATAWLGATALSLPTHLPATLRRDLARRAGVACCICDDPQALPPGPPGLRLAGDSGPASPAPVPAPTAPFLLIASSGSTGGRKLMAVTHARWLARLALSAQSCGLGPGDRLMTLSSLDYTSPMERCQAALWAGAAVVLADPRHLPQVCEHHRVNVLHATVVHLEALLAACPPDAPPVLPGLRLLQVGASPVSERLRARVRRAISPALHVRYGTNEAGPISQAVPDDLGRVPGTVGRPLPGVVVEIVDATGRPVAPGEAGLVRLRSPGLVDGYLGDPTATRAAFRDGWFWPGDRARLDASGQLVHLGRADAVMVFNGVNIHPGEIEQVLLAHPAVCDAVAFSLRHDWHGHVPVAAVQLERPMAARVEALRAHAREHLGDHAPRHLVVLDRLPRNAQGKLLPEDLTAAVRRALRPPAPGDAPRPARRPRHALARLAPARSHRVALPRLDAAARTRLDHWLGRVLGLPGLPPPADAVAVDVVSHTAARLAQLVSTLLQGARMPVFDPVQVVAVRPAGHAGSAPADRWEVELRVPAAEGVPPRALTLAVREARTALLWMAGREPAAGQRDALYRGLETRVLAPLASQVPGGKSTLPVLRAAHAAGIPWLHLAAGVFQLGWGARACRLDRSTTEHDAAMGVKLAGNKLWAAAVLRQAGLPAPVHRVADTADRAVEVARQLGWPLVLKPVDGERGEGVCTGLRDEAALRAAVEPALAASRLKTLLVEREVPGVCHRLFMLGGQLLYAVKRLPKSVIGDGRTSVAGLIRAANGRETAAPPWARTEPYPRDALALQTLRAAGYTPDSVPAAGVPVPLRPIESTAWGGHDEDVSARIHPDNLAVARRAAALFGLHVAGIDLITPDISQPWHANGAIVNEVNFAPLLGGGDISRAQLPRYLRERLGGTDGRVPVEVYVGGEAARAAALARQRELARRGRPAWLCSHAATWSPDGGPQPVAADGLAARSRALLLDPAVQGVVLLVQTDAALATGLPVDRLDRLTVVDHALLTTGGAPASADVVQALLDALHELLVS